MRVRVRVGYAVLRESDSQAESQGSASGGYGPKCHEWSSLLHAAFLFMAADLHIPILAGSDESCEYVPT